MANFCPQCGSKLQPDFKFCPSCGNKLPEEQVDVSSPKPSETPPNTDFSSPTPMEEYSSQSALVRQPLRLTRRKTLGKTDTECVDQKPASSSQKRKTPPSDAEEEQLAKKTAAIIMNSPDKMPLRTSRKGKGSPPVKVEEEKETLNNSFTLQTPDKMSVSVGSGKHKASPLIKEEQTKQNPPAVRSPSTAKSKKRVCVGDPLQEGTVLCDQSGKKWKLVQLLCKTEIELTYAACQANQNADSNECKHILRLGAKEGHLFNEQNFYQRAAKPDAVEKWRKLNKLDFLGIPSCVGFGLQDLYRFLVFPSMGQTLESLMDEGNDSLSEKTVLQLALQLLDSLEFIHEKEYAHADIHAGNVYITGGNTKAFLSGFGHAFRFCPGGQHVEFKQGSRTPHQGSIIFISLDSHKGAGPSRRSDLQSLGYCMLFWMTGSLPWCHLSHSSSSVAAEKERYLSNIPELLSWCYKQNAASSALEEYLSAVMALQYTEKPDYTLLKAGLQRSL